jgi:circadian clock protein KaiB
MTSSSAIEPRHGAEAAAYWHLRLYVAGQSPKSLNAFTNLTRVCNEHLESRYEIEIVDLVEHPELAAGDEIIAIPTLVRRLPPPMLRVIGDLSDVDRVLAGLQLRGGDDMTQTEQPLTRELEEGG